MTTRSSMVMRLAVLGGGRRCGGAGGGGGRGGRRRRRPKGGERHRSALKGIPQSGIALGSPEGAGHDGRVRGPSVPVLRGVPPRTSSRRSSTATCAPGSCGSSCALLRFLGPDSDRLARVAAAAAAQNRMWQFVGLAYASQGRENSGYATNDFINKPARGRRRCKRLDAGAAAERQCQRRAALAARRAGIDSTPSFLIGRTGGTLSPLPADPTLTPGAVHAADRGGARAGDEGDRRRSHCSASRSAPT